MKLLATTTKRIITCVIVVLSVTATSRATWDIVSPDSAAAAYGSGYFPMQNGFDDQPVWDGENSMPTNNEVYAGSDAPYYLGRAGYVDFGEDFADITLYEGWTRYRAWSGGTGCGYDGAFWTDTDPGAWPGALPPDNKPTDAIDDTTVNFNNDVVPNQGTRLWMKSFEYATGYTLERRYLVMLFADDATGLTNNRAEEYAFIGEVGAAPAVLLGDANNDGVVSADDFAAVQTNFGNTGAADGLLPGDANDDGVVSADDFAAIQTNFGNVLGAAAEAAPVPEPATMALLAIGGLAALRRRR